MCIRDSLDGASDEFDQELVDKGELSPVFFGSALTTFGVQTLSLIHIWIMDSEPEKRMELRRMLVDNYSVIYTICDERVIVTDVLYLSLIHI